MRATVLLVPWLALGVTGCDAFAMEPGGSPGEGGAKGSIRAEAASTAQAGAGASGRPTDDTTPGTSQLACRRVCELTTRSECVDATRDLDACTTQCENALLGACGAQLAEYVACAQDGHTVLCDYGPVVYDCMESFYGFIECAER